MKVYLAGPWSDRALMGPIAQQLDDRGHKITHPWWIVEKDIPDFEWDDRLREHALLDIQGVMNADVVLLINTKQSEGKAVEQGVAIACHIPIIAVGERGKPYLNVFHWLDNYTWCTSIDEAIAFLDSPKLWDRILDSDEEAQCQQI
jgi:nucleoside 2-deoxyribosyltransferase